MAKFIGENRLGELLTLIKNKFVAKDQITTTYSTNEKVVGTWIDGKPIYQKTIDGYISTSDYGVDIYNYYDMGIGIEVETFVNISGFIQDEERHIFYQLPLTWQDSSPETEQDYIAYCRVGGIDALNPTVSRTNSVALLVNAPILDNTKVYLTVQYTKLTD